MNDESRKGIQPNFLDRAISFIAPVVGAQRMMARGVLHEFSNPDGAGGNPGIRRGSSGGQARNGDSESYGKNRDRINDMWDARNLCDLDWIGGTLSRVVLYTIGELEQKSNTGVPEIDEAYDQYFKEWAGEAEDDDGLTRCDVSGRHPLIKMIQMALLAMLVDGDHGFLATVGADPSGEAGDDIQLQQIEADRIGSPNEVHVAENYLGGVSIDPTKGGRPVSYRIYDRSPVSGQYSNPREIEPANFIHLWDPRRSDQFRGRSILRPVLPDIRDIREWVASEKQAGKVQSQWAALFSTRNPNAKNGAAAWEGVTPSGTPCQDAHWGKILRMSEGESFSMLAPPSRPGGAFLQFIQTIIRKIAVALDLPFGFVWDLATLGGVTARIEVQQAQRRINGFQSLLVRQVLRRVRRMVLSRPIGMGLLPAHPLWRQCEWHFGPWIVTDAGYETQNDIALIDAGLMDPDEATQKRSKSFFDIARSRLSKVKGLQRMSEESVVPIEGFMGARLFPGITEQLAAMQSPPPTPPEPGSVESVGDAGAKQVLELLKSVGEGTTDRASAVATLVSMYHFPPAQAEAIVPAGAIMKDEL